MLQLFPRLERASLLCQKVIWALKCFIGFVLEHLKIETPCLLFPPAFTCSAAKTIDMHIYRLGTNGNVSISKLLG
jgi:hypothetical protein